MHYVLYISLLYSVTCMSADFASVKVFVKESCLLTYLLSLLTAVFGRLYYCAVYSSEHSRSTKPLTKVARFLLPNVNMFVRSDRLK